MTRMLIAILAAGVAAAPAAADTVTLAGSPIPLAECTIRDMRSGRLYFADARGRRQWREIEEIARLGFDDLPRLDEAEVALASGDTEGGLHALLQALLDAPTDLQRLWIRVRLVAVHDARGEFTQAAGHAAAVFLTRDDAYWRHLEPRSPPGRTGFAALHETYHLLREAQRSVQSDELAAVVERLMQKVAPLYQAEAARYEGPSLEPGTTLSGVPKTQIRIGRFPRGAATGDREASGRGDRSIGGRERAGAATPREPAVPPPSPEGGAAERVPADAVERLIADGRAEEAVALCSRLAKQPGSRNLARFLHQYGRALVLAGRPREAGVMFMRVAILFESSAYAAPSLVQTALVYRDVYRNQGAVRRLLERAVEAASRQGQDDVIAEANAILATLDREEAR